MKFSIGTPNLNKTEQILACILISLVLGSILYQFAIIPELRHVKTARFQLSFQQDLLKTMAMETQHRDALSNRIRKLEAEMAQASSSLFNRDAVRDFLRSLSRLSSQTGSVLTNITPYNMRDLPPAGTVARRSEKKQQAAEVEGDRSFMAMPVKVAIRGDYSEVIRFLGQLQAYGQLMTISKLKIAAAYDPSEVDAEFTLNLYIYEDQEA